MKLGDLSEVESGLRFFHFLKYCISAKKLLPLEPCFLLNVSRDI